MTDNEELVRKMMQAVFKLKRDVRKEGFERMQEKFEDMRGPFEDIGSMRFEFRSGHPFDKMGHGLLGRERILVILARYPDGVHQKDIMQEAGIGPSSLSELIDKLESDGYVERRTDPDDRRATLIFLTDKGRARAAEVQDERNEMFADYFRNFSEEDKQNLSDLLDKIINA